MADARRLMVLALVARAGMAVAATPCAEEEGALGVRVGVAVGAVQVEAVAASGPAAQADLHVGDTLEQANATLLHACGDWSRAVRDAKRERKAVLLLVRRGGAAAAVALGADVWGAPPPQASQTSGPATKPVFPAPEATPPPLPDAVAVSYGSVRADLGRLAPSDPEALPALGDYRKAVTQVRRAIAALAARHAAPEERVNALRVALRPFEAAEVAWDAIEGDREREHRMRRVPTAEEATASYFDDSQAAAVLDEFPFLRPTVVRDPSPGIFQSAGQWHPVQARALLWQHGRDVAGKLPAP